MSDQNDYQMANRGQGLHIYLHESSDSAASIPTLLVETRDTRNPQRERLAQLVFVGEVSIGGLWGLQGTQLVMGLGWRTYCHKQTERVIRVWVWVRPPDPGGVPEKQRIGREAS